MYHRHLGIRFAKSNGNGGSGQTLALKKIAPQKHDGKKSYWVQGLGQAKYGVG